MKVLNNRRVAWIVLALSVVISIVGMGGGHLAAQRRDIMRVFNAGIDDSFAVRFSMDAYLENCAEYASVMAEEYKLHVRKDDPSAANLVELASMIGDGDDLENRYSAYKAMCSAVESLYTDFHAASVTEEDQTLFSHAYSNFQGEVSKIEYDEYHALAEKFNRRCETFPANFVCRLLGIEPMSTF